MKSLFNKLVGGKQEGKVIKVGNYTVQIVKQIAEGGFSYVFLCKDNHGKHYALKRVLTHDDEELQHVQQEASVMRQLCESEHKNIVKFYDSCVIASTKQAETSEVYILMEYCSGGHLVDIMNSKPQRFSESDILSIFHDVCQAVAHMHLQDPPMAHRDLKVENVLLDEHTGLFKLCDFGSVTTKTIRPMTKQEIGFTEEEIQKHTTLQYRAPEMIDLYQHKLISEKVDIWALGCVLYKLAYYKTPFEDAGTLQILNVDYTIPAGSPYSQNLQSLIRLMLNPNPDTRPDIFDVIDEVCKLRNISSPPRPKMFAKASLHPPEPLRHGASPAHTPSHSPSHSPKPSPAGSPVPHHHNPHHSSPTYARHQTQQTQNQQNHQNHDTLSPLSAHSQSPTNYISPPPNHISPPTLQTSQSHGIAPRSPAQKAEGGGERPSHHRRTASTTDRSVASAVEHLRGRTALTASSPAVPPPSSSVNPSPLLPLPPVTLHPHHGRRRKTEDMGENPFTSPLISPVVSPSITPAGQSPTPGLHHHHHHHENGSPALSLGGEGTEADGLSIDACVKGATDSSKSVPDHAYTSRLLNITFETHTAQPILDVVMKQPLTNAFVCLKSVSLVHRLMQDGYQQALVDLQSSAQLYNNLYLGWTKHADRAPEMAPILACHALVVYKKIMYHQKTPGLDGKLKSYIAPSPALLSSLLEILSDITKSQSHLSAALSVCPEDLLSNCLSPFINEAIYIYNFLASHLSQEALDKATATSPPPPAQFSSSFSSQLSDLKIFFGVLTQALPTLCSVTIFPNINVPSNPFGGGNAATFNPFSEPNQYDPFFSPPDEPIPMPVSPSPLKTSSGFPRTSSLQFFPTYSPPQSPIGSPSIPRFAVTPATPLQRSTSLLTASLHISRNFEEMSLDSSANIQKPLQQQLFQQQQHQQQQQQQQQYIQSPPNMQQQHSPHQGEASMPRPVAAAFMHPNPHLDHVVQSGNLSPRVKSRDVPTLSQPPPARRSAAHRRAQSNTADDIVRKLDPAQLANIRTASLLGNSPTKR